MIYENFRLGFVVLSSDWIRESSFFILSPKTFFQNLEHNPNLVFSAKKKKGTNRKCYRL